MKLVGILPLITVFMLLCSVAVAGDNPKESTGKDTMKKEQKHPVQSEQPADAKSDEAQMPPAFRNPGPDVGTGMSGPTSPGWFPPGDPRRKEP